MVGPEVRRGLARVLCGRWALGERRLAGAEPCPFGHQARHNLCRRYTRTRARFAYNMSVWVPAYIYFNFYNSDAIPLALHSPSPTFFSLVFPCFLMPAALVMRFKASTLAFVSLAVRRPLYDYVLQDLHKHFYRNINDLKCFEYISM